MKPDSSYGPHAVSVDKYVVRLPEQDRGELRRRVEKLGVVEEVPAHPDLLVLHLAHVSATDAKDAWRAVQDQLGRQVEVNPIVVDEDGQSKYALGSIVVRFPNPPSDEELAAWASEHDLIIRERNKYVPQQVSFGLAHAHRQFLPEVVQSLLKSPQLRCWLDTLSTYRR